MKQLQVRYYATLREQAGCAEETVMTKAATPAEFYQELQKRHGFREQGGRIQVAINDNLVAWNAALADGDRVVFIPPIAGG